jgi:TolA-binding protein
MKIKSIVLALLVFTFSAVAQTPAPAPGADTPAAALTKLFNAGMDAFKAGDYTTASTKLQQVVDQAGPQSQLATVYFILGAAYFNLGNYPQAVERLKTFREKYPANPQVADATYAIAQADLLNKNLEDAAAEFARLEQIPRYRENALRYEALAYKEGGHLDQAANALEKLIAGGVSTPSTVNGAMELAEIYVAQKEPDKAVGLMQVIFDHIDLVENMIRLNSMASVLGDRLLAERSDSAAINIYLQIRTPEELANFQAERYATLANMIQQNIDAMRSNPADAMQHVAANNQLQPELVKAKALYDEATKLPDYTPGLLVREGRAWFDSDKKWESIVVFNRLVTKYPKAKERETALYSMITAYTDLNQAERARQLCSDYIAGYPSGPNASTVNYLQGVAALRSHDPAGAETLFGRTLANEPGSSFREQMSFLLANAKFDQGKYDEAINQYKLYLKDFPTGEYAEESEYRAAVSLVYAAKYEDAIGQLNRYLKDYPKGTFRADAKYRLMVCQYAGQQYDEVITAAASWQKEFPDDEMEGEMLSLLGDSLEAEGKLTEAIPVYVESSKKAKTDEVLNYSLFEAAKDMQKLGQWEAMSDMFRAFVKEKPTNPSVVAAMYWIGRALTHEGRPEEAKKLLVNQLRLYIADPRKEAVEQLLQQLVQLCEKRPRPPATTIAAASGVISGTSSPTPEPTPIPYNASAELDKQLAAFDSNANATTQARLTYARADMAAALRKPDEHDKLIGQIATIFKPEDLSPALLAQAGDYLLTQGSADAATRLYTELKEYFPNSRYLDSAYVGLGDIAYSNKNYQTALKLYTDAADKYTGERIKDATIGRAKCLAELGQFDQATELFNQIASTREWRGDATALAVYSLGDIQARQGHWAESIAYFQRVFVLYQRYIPWVAKAYIGSAASFDKLGKRTEAINHLQEMLHNEKLQGMPETKQARTMLATWGASA